MYSFLSYIFSLEFLGVLCGITSVLLLAKGNAWGFLIGLINTLIYVYIDFTNHIYGQILVNLYYTTMNIIGLIMWRKKDQHNEQVLRYTYTMRKEKGRILLLFSLFFFLLLSSHQIFAYYGLNQAKTPYLDSLITSLIFTAMYLSVRKKIEGWYVWLIVNLSAIVLFYHNGLYITILQYVAYFIIALMGWRNWVRAYKLQNIAPAP